ncbi:MAG TPA: hypothetical protein VE972_14895 [Conexibacter sp.]|nr:hypothetical protein [Conexibacter sp.]
MPAPRAFPLAACAAAAVLAATVAGCDYGSPATITPQQQQARIAFLDAHADFSDRELAQLCPGLYPTDFLTNTSKYREAKRDGKRKAPKVTATDRAQAHAAGCDVRP